MLLGIVCFGLLIALLIKSGSTSGEIEKLKQQLRALEQRFKELGSIKIKEVVRPESVVEKPVVTSLPPPLPSPGKPVSASDELLHKEVVQPYTMQGEATPVEPVRSAPPPLKQKKTDPLDFLRGIGCWPPKRQQGSAELALMQWWAPRIGGGLAVLSIIFFAVYVAQGTPPWVKFMEMVVASFGVFGLGAFFSKKRPGLGNVLVATGLSMIYISSVAGYAVGPVRVVENPLIGALMQTGRTSA